MNITINITRVLTTADLWMACDPVVEFEVRSRMTPDWARRVTVLEQENQPDVETALELIGEAFVSISQNGERYPLNSKEAATELMSAVEAGNPGSGEQFMVELCLGFASNHYNFLAKNSTTSGRRSQPSNGTKAKKTPVSVS